MAAADNNTPSSSGDTAPAGTTGHEWDGIRELDNPLPRWWLWTWYACILWAIAYWVVMPAWPTISGYTTGVIGYSQRAVVEKKIAQNRDAQSVYLERIAAKSLAEIRNDPELLSFSMAGGRSAFAVNCSQCHGSGAQGSKGYPNLNDDAWMWGGKLEQISYTIRHGVRNGDDDARVSEMSSNMSSRCRAAPRTRKRQNAALPCSRSNARYATARTARETRNSAPPT